MYDINENNLTLLYKNGTEIKEIAKKLKMPYKVIWRRLKKLGIETKRKTRNVNDTIFSLYNKDTCYWAGFVAADGCIRKDSPYLGVELAYEDINHIISFKNFMESDVEISVRTRTQKSGKITKYCGILIYSHQIEKDLKEKFNIISKKSKIIKPPLNIPNEFVKDFIRGDFDGDGTISWHKANEKPRIQFASGSYSFISWIKQHIEVNVPNIGNPTISQNKKWKTYLLEYMGKQIVPIMEWLYNDNGEFRLTRKFKRFLKYKSKLEEMERKQDEIKIKREQRNIEIIELHKSGLTYKQISQKMNISQATCCNVFNHMG